jgi:hypothetical protein
MQQKKLMSGDIISEVTGERDDGDVGTDARTTNGKH